MNKKDIPFFVKELNKLFPDAKTELYYKTKTPLETDKKISKYFSKQNHSELHNTLVLFGRYNCIAKKPKCGICSFLEKCNYKN